MKCVHGVSVRKLCEKCASESKEDSRPVRKPDVEFCNGEAECGCRLEFTSGNGEYSDSVSVWLCPTHKKRDTDKENRQLKTMMSFLSGQDEIDDGVLWSEYSGKEIVEAFGKATAQED